MDDEISAGSSVESWEGDQEEEESVAAFSPWEHYETSAAGQVDDLVDQLLNQSYEIRHRSIIRSAEYNWLDLHRVASAAAANVDIEHLHLDIVGARNAPLPANQTELWEALCELPYLDSLQVNFRRRMYGHGGSADYSALALFLRHYHDQLVTLCIDQQSYHPSMHVLDEFIPALKELEDITK